MTATTNIIDGADIWPAMKGSILKGLDREAQANTLRCGATRVRLQGIDAPEMPGHCRQGRECTPGDPYASTDNLRRLVSGGTMSCRQTDTDRYGRAVASCDVDGIDLSCEQVRSGNAIRRYAPLSC